MNDNRDIIIAARNITKVYVMGQEEVHALGGISLDIRRGEYLSIMGPSGSGKSTLMNIIGCLDRPTKGSYALEGSQISDLDDDQLAEIRNRKIGFVFQTFNLLGRQTALSNVELPMRYAGVTNGMRKRALEALEAVGLGDRVHHRPNELSGGQQQRVAVARALVNNPSMILADEPTGNLDSRSGEEIISILTTLHTEQGITLLMVTHDTNIAHQCQRIIHLKDGQMVAEENG